MQIANPSVQQNANGKNNVNLCRQNQRLRVLDLAKPVKGRNMQLSSLYEKSIFRNKHIVA